LACTKSSVLACCSCKYQVGQNGQSCDLWRIAKAAIKDAVDVRDSRLEMRVTPIEVISSDEAGWAVVQHDHRQDNPIWFIRGVVLKH